MKAIEPHGVLHDALFTPPVEILTPEFWISGVVWL